MAKKEEMGKVPNSRNTPILRFPEFVEEWQTKKLKEITTKINSGKTPLGGEAAYTTKGVTFIRSQNVNNNQLELDNVAFISEATNKQMRNSIVEPNDILLNITGASLGRSCVVPNDFEIGNVNQHVCIIRLKNGNSSRYFQSILASTKGQNIFKSLQTGSGREGLNFESIKGITVHIPPSKEQEKISFFISLLDNRIQTQSKIIQKLETSIQNLRERFFSQKIRFKDCNGLSFSEWTKIKLGDIANRIVSKNKENNKNVLTISAQHGLISQLDFFNKSVSAKDLTGYFLLSRNHFAYNKSYSNGYPMGAIKRLTHYDKGVVSTLYICFDFKANVNLDFMEHYFEAGIQNTELEKVAQEGARNHGLLNIGLADFFNIKITIPSLDEQNVIGKFLSKLQRRIEIEKQLLLKYESQKKYLLRNLFI